MVSIVGRLFLGRRIHAIWFDVVSLILELVNYVFFLMIAEGMGFTVRSKSRYRFCVTPDGSHIYSRECNAVYAALAFASLDLLLSFVAAIGIGFVIHCECYTKWKGARQCEPSEALSA